MIQSHTMLNQITTVRPLWYNDYVIFIAFNLRGFSPQAISVKKSDHMIRKFEC